MTIRRDLEKLDACGAINRCHGGAVSKHEVLYADKRVHNSDIKLKIANECRNYVHESNVIFLDAGTTTYQIAEQISRIQDITVVTNDIEIVKLLMDSDVELIVCGGNVQKSTGSIYGYYSTQMLEQMKFDIGFFGTAAVDEHLSVMTPTTDKAFLKRLAVKKCQNSFLVSDHSKFDKTALTYVNSLEDYDHIVTDFTFSKEERQRLKNAGTEMIQVK